MSDSDFLELCKSGDAKKVEEAILNGANVNAKANDGSTALMYALDNDTAKILIEYGADVNAKDSRGKTALMYALDSDIAETLIEHGADANARDNDGMTALMWAAITNNSTLEAIIGYSDVNARDNYGVTALMMAQGYPDAEDLLRYCGAES